MTKQLFYSAVSKRVGDFFKFLYPFQKSWTLLLKICFLSQVKDQLSLKIHGKNSGPNAITSSAEAYIIIHETHHSHVTCVQYNWANFRPGGTSKKGMMGFMNSNVSFSDGCDSNGIRILSKNLQWKMVFELCRKSLQITLHSRKSLRYITCKVLTFDVFLI